MPSATPSAASAGTPLLIKLAAQPDFSKVELMPRGADRKSAAWNALVQTAASSQPALTAIAEKLKSNGAIVGYQTLVSPNMLIVTPASGQQRKVMESFQNSDVKSVFDNSSGTQLWPPAPPTLIGPDLPAGQPWGLDVVPGTALAGEPDQTPYGVKLVGAPDAWSKGADGRGLVFGSIDTGADVTHPALKAAYRGTQADGTLVNDYNWIDFDSSPSPVPVDSEGHGTHTIGTVVGSAPTAAIGVAPGAKWISAHGLSGTVDAALRALQWMQAPTRLDGTAADATKAPDVVGMSWYMGSSSQDLFRESIRNLRAAGIEPVKSAGNQGPGAHTITSPGQFPEITAVAAVDDKGKVANFSSRGPAPFPAGSTTPKPDFAAPGVNVLSSLPGGKYGTMSGTSMAQPHMSGVLLDILSKYPQLTHDQLVAALASTATDAGKPGRDDEYGAGIVNIPAALAAAAKLESAATPASPHHKAARPAA